MPKKKAPSERACSRLTKRERQAIERMPDRGKGGREIAREVGRAPSTVANEAERHRFATSPRALPGDARAGAWEMDAVVGRRADSARPLALHHGPTGFRLAIPVADGTRAPAPAAAPGRVAARALMDAFGVEMLEPAELDLTPGCVERARADGGEAPLAE